MKSVKYILSITPLTLFMIVLSGQNVLAQPRGGAPHRSAREAERLIEDGDKFTGEHKWADAIKAYKRATLLRPNDAEAYMYLGDAYMNSGQAKAAFAAYERAIRIEPKNADAHYSLGAAYNDMAQYGDALIPFVQAIRIKPDYAEAHYGIGRAYQKLDNNNEAVRYLQQAIKLKRDYSEAYYDLGLAYLSLGNRNAVEEQCELLETMDPSLANKLSREIQKPLLQETINWLAAKVTANGRISLGEYGDVSTQELKQLDGCKLQLVLIKPWDTKYGISDPVKYESIISLSDVDPLSIEVSKVDACKWLPSHWVVKYSGLTSGSIKMRMTHYRTREMTEIKNAFEPKDVIRDRIQVSNEETAGLIADAMKYAVKLCGGKINPS